MPSTEIWIVVFLVGVVAWALAARWRSLRRRSAERLEEGDLPQLELDEDTGAVARWLSNAGEHDRGAVARFWRRMALAVVGAVIAAFLVANSPTIVQLSQWAADIPGGFGGLIAPILVGAPWIVFGLVASLPLAAVSRRRRRRVEGIERDLPVLLELLATLGEAGLAFDAALDRVLRGQPRDQELSRELRLFQKDVQAGMPRWRAFRRLAKRCEVPSVSMFTSALIQSEQVGSGLADSLRGQSADHWNRRREKALLKAQSLPARMSIPLVVCFLPSLFVITLGPIPLEFIKLAESVLNQGA